MDYKELLEIAIRENAMLKNSFRIMSDRTEKIISHLNGTLYSTARLTRIEDNVLQILRNQGQIYARLSRDSKAGRKGTKRNKGRAV